MLADKKAPIGQKLLKGASEGLFLDDNTSNQPCLKINCSVA